MNLPPDSNLSDSRDRRHAAVDSGDFIDVRGLEQWVTIRGDNAAQPALLLLTGPGVGFCRLAPLFAPLESAFTLVQWDQPLAGVTEARHRGTDSGEYSFDRLAADAAAVVEYACGRLGLPAIAVLGLSGGTITALHLLRRRPDLVSAYVGSGQIVNWATQEALGYAATLSDARRQDDTAAIAALERIGPPPYPDVSADLIKSNYTGALTRAESEALAALPPGVTAQMQQPAADARYVPPGYRPADTRAVALAAYEALRHELIGFDAYALGTRYPLPMTFIQGDLDWVTDSGEVQAFAASLECPAVRFTSIAGGGHSAFFLRERFFEALAASLGGRPIAAAPR